MFAPDPPFGDDGAIDQDAGNAEVVEAMQLIVGVDIGELRLGVQLLEKAQGLVAQVAPLPGHEDDAHQATLTDLRGRIP